MVVYHGTSSDVLARIMSDTKGAIRRVFMDSNVSLGGTYVTKRRDLAEVYAAQAARQLGGVPVVLELDVPQSDLLPDEDWAVDAAEAREPASKREQAFLDDLFVGYLGEGFSLSDHYKERYAELNERHHITWRDSWRWRGTARLDRPLTRLDLRRPKVA